VEYLLCSRKLSVIGGGEGGPALERFSGYSHGKSGSNFGGKLRMTPSF